MNIHITPFVTQLYLVITLEHIAVHNLKNIIFANFIFHL